jgi:hypothetical protein
METWIRGACRQRAFRQLAVWALLTAAIAAAFVAANTYWRNFFQGPYQVTAADLASIDPEISERRFLAVNGTKAVNSGVQVITTETRNGVKERSYVSSEYYLLVVGDRILIVESKGQPSTHIEGEVKNSSANLENQIFSDPDDQPLRARLYPFIVSTTDSYLLPGYVALVAGAIYLFVLWRYASRAWRYSQDVSLHPVVKRVEAWPDAVEAVVMSEREMNTVVRFKRSNMVITDNFLIYKGPLTFNLFPLKHLIWAYQKVTTRRLYFVIPISKTQEAVLKFYGGNASLQGPEKLVHEVLGFVASRAPWAILGYTEQIAKAFNNDTSGFCAVVEERRTQLSR